MSGFSNVAFCTSRPIVNPISGYYTVVYGVLELDVLFL